MRIIYFVIPDSVRRFLGVGSVLFVTWCLWLKCILGWRSTRLGHSTAQPAGQTGHESVHSAKHYWKRGPRTVVCQPCPASMRFATHQLSFSALWAQGKNTALVIPTHKHWLAYHGEPHQRHTAFEHSAPKQLRENSYWGLRWGSCFCNHLVSDMEKDNTPSSQESKTVFSQATNLLQTKLQKWQEKHHIKQSAGITFLEVKTSLWNAQWFKAVQCFTR